MQEHGGPPTQAQLAEYAGTDLMMTSHVLRRRKGRGRSRATPIRPTAGPGGCGSPRRAASCWPARCADVEAADQAYFAVWAATRTASAGR